MIYDIIVYSLICNILISSATILYNILYINIHEYYTSYISYTILIYTLCILCTRVRVSLTHSDFWMCISILS